MPLVSFRRRQPPALALEPARAVRLLGRAAQRPNLGEVRGRERRREPSLGVSVAPADARDDAGARGEADRISRAAALDDKERAPQVGVGERNQQLSTVDAIVVNAGSSALKAKPSAATTFACGQARERLVTISAMIAL
jgi:hypothetical protein